MQWIPVFWNFYKELVVEVDVCMTDFCRPGNFAKSLNDYRPDWNDDRASYVRIRRIEPCQTESLFIGRVRLN